jgi:hypothetical protein
MQQYRFRLVQKTFGYEVFYQSAAPGAPLQDLLGEDFELNFRILISDPNFYNYSDLEVVDFQTHIYHSKWQVTTNKFAFHSVTNSMVELVDSGTELSDENDHHVQLADGIRRTDFGLLAITFPADASTSPDSFDAENNPALALAFSSRKTRWRYFLIPSPGQFDAASATILGGAEQSDQSLFVRAEQNTLLPNGNEAITLVSKQALALKEKYPAHFTLKIDRSENGATIPISIPLPNPSLDRINAERSAIAREEITEYYSDLYIYL